MSAQDIFRMIEAHQEVIGTLSPKEIQFVADKITESLKKGGKLMVFGNGGSAADSQHMAAELVGRFLKEKPPLAAISLTANTSLLTAVANDYGNDVTFSKQIEALGKKEDIALGISTSGKSKNILKAIEAARKIGIFTVGLTGKDGGDLAKQTDFCLFVKSQDTPRIQEAHSLIIHIICELVENNFTSSGK